MLKKHKYYTIIFVIILFFVVVILSIRTCSQKVGFPNNNIYYNMSINSLKHELGECQFEYDTERDSKCYIYSVEFRGIEGKSDFEFFEKKLSGVTFTSDSGGYDKSTFKKTIEYIENFYSKKNGFEITDADFEDNNYSFCLNDSNGATGKYVDIVLDNAGKLIITAESIY